MIAVVATIPALAEEDEANYNHPQHQQAETQYAAPKNDADAAFWKDKTGGPEHYRAICDKPKDREYADLCQQWRVAETAEKQFYASLVGIFGLLATIFYAHLTLRQSDQTSRAQLRAYVHVMHVRRSPAKLAAPSDEISIVVENRGQTPAYNVVVWSTLTWSQDEAQATFPEEDLTKVPRTTIGPSANHAITRFLNHSLPGYARFLSGNGVLLVYGRVEYRDAFSKLRITNFRLVNRDPRIGSFAICEEGNDAA